MLRWKPEALAALRRTYDLLCQELRQQAGACGCYRTPTAYELIEGRDTTLCNAFAQTTAYVLASSRMAAPAFVPYINVASRAAVGQQARISLQVLVRRWREYASVYRAPHYGGSRDRYFM